MSSEVLSKMVIVIIIGFDECINLRLVSGYKSLDTLELTNGVIHFNKVAIIPNYSW